MLINLPQDKKNLREVLMSGRGREDTDRVRDQEGSFLPNITLALRRMMKCFIERASGGSRVMDDAIGVRVRVQSQTNLRRGPLSTGLAGEP